jgi:pectinesterase
MIDKKESAMQKKRLLFLMGLMLCSLCGTMLAGTAASVTWALTADQTVTTIGGQITGTAQSFTAMTVNSYSATTLGPLGVKSQSSYPTSSTAGYWPNETAYNSARYIEFTVAPAVNNNLTVTSFSIPMAGQGGGNVMIEIFYSTDGFATSTHLNSSTIQLTKGVYTTSSYTDLSIPVPQGSTLSLRIYPYYKGGTGSGKYLDMQDVVISGTTTPIPVASSATWPLLVNDTATVSGLLNAGGISFDGTNLYHGGYGTNGDRWTNHLPSDGAWPAELSPNFSRYAQFAVAPQTGVTLYVDSVRFNQVAESAATLRVALYYSKDSTFATQTFIADTTVPASLTSYRYTLSEDTIQTGQKFYLRFYPYDTNADISSAMIDVNSVAVYMNTTGSVVALPTVTTTAVSYISTTFLTTGGNVTADGGGSVTAKGVCWNVGGSPTTSDSYLSGGTDVGSFKSSVTGLSAGATYHFRAYATNLAGTVYGSEITATTLTGVVNPTVTTTALSSVMAVTAKSGGNVTAWGGDSVTAKGICWNTTGSPVISTDAYTTDGSDIGSYSSALSGLVNNTAYHVRAYGTNSAGTGYGSEIIFTTQAVSPDSTVVVAKDGSGNYTKVGDALRNVPSNYTGTWRIFVKKGNYHEKDTLASGKVNVILEGEERDSTLIWNDDFSDKYGTGNPGTSGTYTITIDADDFLAKNITFENTYWPSRYGTVTGTQGVAVSTNGDRQQFLNCAFNGYQDTYYTRGSSATGRTYHKNCIFKGTVDYIFGRNICVFDSCTFMTVRAGGTITAGGTDAASLYGYVFRNCTLLGDTVASTDSTGWVRSVISASSGWLLGRPWQSSPRTVFLDCYESANIAAAGWTTMSVNPTLYAEYNCWGPGAASSRTVNAAWTALGQPATLSNAVVTNYTLAKIFARSSASSSLILYDWYPSLATASEDMNFILTDVSEAASVLVPVKLTLGNYPNPFNPETKIQFSVAKSGIAVVKVYNLLGQEVARVFEGAAQAGKYYTVSFGGSRFASGVYFYSLESDGQHLIKKMILLK